MQKFKTVTGFRCAVLLLTVAIMVTPCPANPLSALRNLFARPHGADSLIVTGNYLRPRLLAELIQWKTKDPILLVSGNGSQRVFYVSVSRESPLEIDANSYVEFIELLNPRRVVVLGNSEVVPNRTADILQDRFPTVMVTGSNWGVNAAAAANLFNYKRLNEHYARYFRSGVSNVGRKAPQARSETPPRSSQPPASLRSGQSWQGNRESGSGAPMRPSREQPPASQPMQAPVIQPID